MNIKIHSMNICSMNIHWEEQANVSICFYLNFHWIFIQWIFIQWIFIQWIFVQWIFVQWIFIELFSKEQWARCLLRFVLFQSGELSDWATSSEKKWPKENWTLMRRHSSSQPSVNSSSFGDPEKIRAYLLNQWMAAPLSASRRSWAIPRMWGGLSPLNLREIQRKSHRGKSNEIIIVRQISKKENVKRRLLPLQPEVTLMLQ